MKNQIASATLFTASLFSTMFSFAAMPIGGMNEHCASYSPNITIWMACSVVTFLISTFYLGAVLSSDNN